MRSKPFLVIGLIIEAISVASTLVSGWAVHESTTKRDQLQFEREVDRGMSAARARLNEYEYALHAAKGLFAASEDVTRDDWRSFVDELDPETRYPGVLGFGFIRRTSPDAVDDLVERAASSGLSELRITTLGEVPPGDRFIIDYIEPLALNRPAAGLDIGSNAVRREAALAAMLTGRATITNRITLVQDDEKLAGFLMLVPVYEGGRVPGTEQQRRDRCIGWTYAPFVAKTTMIGVPSLAGVGVTLSIYDGERDPTHAIYRDSAAVVGDLALERKVGVAGKTWLFSWNTTAEHTSRTGDDGSWWIIALGLITSMGLLVVMLLLHRANNRALDAAASASRAKSDFLAVMSHEIRTPLNGVIGAAELLASEPLDPAAMELAQALNRSSRGLLALVNDVLDYSRVEAGCLDLELAPFRPSAQVRESVDLFRQAAASKGVELDLEIEDDAPAFIGDSLRFRQIALNLISNAVKFTSQGTVGVKLSSGREGIELVVSDTGVGMDEQAMHGLFDAFSQAESSTSRRFGGSGLGLWIVKHLVGLMGGDIRVESELTYGTRFHVAIPLDIAESTPAVSTPDGAEPLVHALHVLIAEDNEINRLVAGNMLDRLGCTWEMVEDGAQAVAAASTGETLRGLAAVRRAHVPCPAVATGVPGADRRVRVRFDKPVTAPAPGQALVLYDESGRVLGGGWIAS